MRNRRGSSVANTAEDKWPLPEFMAPRGIAVVGASPQAGAGSIVLRNLERLGYAGRVYPVNPKYGELFGHTCYPSLSAIPAGEPVDAAAILLGSGRLVPVLEEAADRGVRGAWAFASGFAETGATGEALQREVGDVCRRRRLMFCGPNCVGFANLVDRVAMYSAPLPRSFRTGRIGVIAQSGAVLLALGNSNRRAGFSRLISSGNEAVLDLSDYLDYLVDDEATRVIALFVESLRKPAAFGAACARAAQAGKAVIALKVGRSELAQKVAATHTGAMAGSDAVLDAAFRRWGVIRVHTMDELLETAVLFEALGHTPPASTRIGLCTVSGGEMGMLADLAEDHGLRFPPLSAAGQAKLASLLPAYTPVANPLDAWGSGDLREAYPASLNTLAAEPAVDAVVVSQDMPGNMTDEQVAQFADVARAAVAARATTGKPVMVLSNISGGLDPDLHSLLEAGGVPVLQGSATGLGALRHLADWGARQAHAGPAGAAGAATAVAATTVAETGFAPLPDDLRVALQAASGLAPYPLAARLLAHYGLPLVNERLVADLDGAVAAAAELGFPVALKALVAGVAHKTETGLVALGLHDAASLREAGQRVLANVARHHAGLPLEGLLVQRMAGAGAVETLVGVQHDAAFGPVVVAGLGGVLVEVLRDTALELAPLGEATALGMLASLKGARLLGAFRGRGPADVAALAAVLVKVGQMAHALGPKLVSLDLNPVLVLPEGQGVCLVDVVMELAAS